MLLDLTLTGYQPIHGRVQVILGHGVVKAQFQGQAGGPGFGLEISGGSQFGAGCDDPGDDHGDGQGPFRARPRAEQMVQSDLADGPEGGGHMSMGQTAKDLEPTTSTWGAWRRPSCPCVVGDGREIATQCIADQFDHMQGQVGEIAHGLVLDLSV
jgi:hypothetical protein